MVDWNSLEKRKWEEEGFNGEQIKYIQERLQGARKEAFEEAAELCSKEAESLKDGSQKTDNPKELLGGWALAKVLEATFGAWAENST